MSRDTSPDRQTAPPIEEIDEQDDFSMSSFEEMLDDYDFDRPKSGEILKGIVLAINENEIILDIGGKHDAIVPRRDLERMETETLEDLNAGDEVMVYVLRQRGPDGELLVSLNKALTQEDWERAEQLEQSGDVIEVEVIGTNKGGALVSFGRLRGFVPNSQLSAIPRGVPAERQNTIKAELVGQKISAKVIEVNQRRNRLVLSETAATRLSRKKRLEALGAGQIVTGRVVKLMEYGAFVDIGDGLNGLIHISKLDWQHVEHPADVLTVGDEIEVLIEDVDIERERISLNRQATIPDPWTTIAESSQINSLVTGKISSVADYGVFVELPNGITGLVHVSEMASYNITDPRKWAEEGAEVLVRIINIDADRKRIGLSLDAVNQQELYDWMTERGEDAGTALQAALPADDMEEDEEQVEIEAADEAAAEIDETAQMAEMAEETSTDADDEEPEAVELEAAGAES